MFFPSRPSRTNRVLGYRSHLLQLETLEGRYYPGDTILGWTLLGSGLFALARDRVPSLVDVPPNHTAGALEASRLAIFSPSSAVPVALTDESRLAVSAETGSANPNAVSPNSEANALVRGVDWGWAGIVDPFAEPLQNPWDKAAKPPARGLSSDQAEIGSRHVGAEAAPPAGAAGTYGGAGTASTATPTQEYGPATLSGGLGAMAPGGPGMLSAGLASAAEAASAGAQASAVANPAATSTPSSSQSASGQAAPQLPLDFEANRGQTDAQVHFLTHGHGYSLFLTSTEAVMVLPNRAASPAAKVAGTNSLEDAVARLRGEDAAGQAAATEAGVVRMQWVGANPGATVVGLDELPGKSNYFLGNDPNKWVTDVPHYGRVTYQNIYPGVDLVYHGNSERQLEYDFKVAPGVDPSVIRLAYTGADSVTVDAQDNLVVHTAAGDVVEKAPVIYQDTAAGRQSIAGHFLLEGNAQIGFAVGAYDASQPLVIDPIYMNYGTYLGGSGDDAGESIAKDKAGNIEIAGLTFSTNFPEASQPPGPENAFVTKLTADGKTRVFSNYLGGNNGQTEAYGIAVDGADKIYVTGATNSPSFPTTPQAFQGQKPSQPGQPSAFLTEFNPNGSSVLDSTYFGGIATFAYGIAVDPAARVNITGATAPSLPITQNAFQPNFGGGFSDGFFASFDLSRTGQQSLLDSTYLGGQGNDTGSGIAVDSLGNAYVTGTTTSQNFPTSSGAKQTTFTGAEDAFLVKINPSAQTGLQSRVYSSLLGGSSNTEDHAIVVDAQGNAYVTGTTDSRDFPTKQAFQSNLNGQSNAFVFELNPVGSDSVISTFLGGSGQDSGNGIAVDINGDINVTGTTNSPNFPTTLDAAQTVLGGGNDAFVTTLYLDLLGRSQVSYSTFLGGSGDDQGTGIVVDASGNAYVTGFTNSNNFSTTSDAFQPINGGGFDAFFAIYVTPLPPDSPPVFVPAPPDSPFFPLSDFTPGFVSPHADRPAEPAPLIVPPASFFENDLPAILRGEYRFEPLDGSEEAMRLINHLLGPRSSMPGSPLVPPASFFENDLPAILRGEIPYSFGEIPNPSVEHFGNPRRYAYNPEVFYDLGVALGMIDIQGSASSSGFLAGGFDPEEYLARLEEARRQYADPKVPGTLQIPPSAPLIPRSSGGTGSLQMPPSTPPPPRSHNPFDYLLPYLPIQGSQTQGQSQRVYNPLEDLYRRFLESYLEAYQALIQAQIKGQSQRVYSPLLDFYRRFLESYLEAYQELIRAQTGSDGGNPSSRGFSSHPVRYFDGTVKLSSTDLFSSGFGTPWGQTRSWTNSRGYIPNNSNGFGMVDRQFPFLIQANGNDTIVAVNGTNARYYDLSGGNYSPHFFIQDQLRHNSQGFVLTDTTGNQLTFFDFNRPPNQRGQLKSFVDPAGNVTSVVASTPDGKPAEVQRSAQSVTESYLYSYVNGGPNNGQLQNVTLRRRTNNGPWTIVRQVDYVYYGVEAHGNVGDLKTAMIKDGSGAVLDTKYYRYYTGENGGFVRGLKFVFNPMSFARLVAAAGDPFNATDAQVAPYADNYFEYDNQRRVTKEVAQGAGSSSNGGLGTFTYNYTSSANPDGFNSWKVKTTETLPDGNQNIVFSNAFGEPMLKSFVDKGSGQQWPTFYQYDAQGRIIKQANPSAVTGYDESKPDLLNNQLGHYQFLKDNDGKIYVRDYYTSTTAGETTPGGVAGYLQDTQIERGQLGTPILQKTTQYLSHSGGGATVHPVATDTVYRNPDGTGAETTSYAYTWFAGTTRMQSRTVNLPVIPAAQNGPGTPDVITSTYDADGQVTSVTNADGFVTTYQYDVATSALTQMVRDASGMGHLNLTTTMVVDALGRGIQLTDPNGNLTYTVYNDPNHEVRTYPGWTGSSTTGPTGVWREDRTHSPSYWERLTMSAAPHVTNGRPDGTEPISNLQTLCRTFTSPGGQVVESDAYFNLSGLVYLITPTLGAAGTNFYPTGYTYDVDGRLHCVQNPTGTATFYTYDGLGRVVRQKVGTSDANAVDISQDVYDGGGVGDSNLTQETDFPGGGAVPRVTQNYFDWRNRMVASKAGVQASEMDGTHRPITYTEYDNLNQAIAHEQYDGDGISITVTNGVPDKPPANLLRVRSTTDYDDQRRGFRMHTYNVDQTNGTISANSLTTNYFFDHRSNTIEKSDPGGLVTKMRYDGVGRMTVHYTSDGGSGADWNSANTVSGDIVFDQMEMSYDAYGNTILTTDRQRFHDETATGSLGDANTGPHARVYYTASYYDAANRRIASVNVGTNGGVAYTRPAMVPDRSDTALVTSYTYNDAGWVQDVTDPRGIATRVLYDALQRRTETIEAYTGGIPNGSSDRTTGYTYDGSGHVLTIMAFLDASQFELTQYVYGVSTAAGSSINSNDLMASTIYPDNGQPHTDGYTYNALGQQTTKTDRNGSTHSFTYDVLGRQTSDTVTMLGAGVDGSIQRIDTAYDTAGRPYLYTSYADPAGTLIVNQVQQTYNGLSQLTGEFQSHSGAVVPGTTPEVKYGYVEMANGANNSRLVSMSYPNGRVLNYNYNAGLDDSISRLSSLSDDTGILEAYTYLGLNTVVRRAHPESGIDLTYIQQPNDSLANQDGGDQYIGLDRFGRVIDQYWIGSAGGTPTDRFQYTYDRDGNGLTRTNLVNTAFNEQYGYDTLNQLTSFARGTHTQSWGLDALGNWSSFTNDGNTQNRSHNLQNEITNVGGNLLGYDNNGNTTTDDKGQVYVYDAWNRLVQVNDSSSNLLASYAYDALGRRVIENSGTARDLYYSAAWQVIEEQVGGTTQVQNVWSPVYVDAMVLRDRDPNGSGTVSERLYVQQDANRNVTALVGLVNSAWTVVERYAYDPYGSASVLAPDWRNLGASNFAWIYLHQGGRFENSTGLYLFRNRDYSLTLGRWVEQDPLGYVERMNLYVDMGNNPPNRTDRAY